MTTTNVMEDRTETATFLTRSTVLIECDWLDEDGCPTKAAQARLTRLDDWLAMGGTQVQSDRQTVISEVVELRKALGIKDRKVVNLAGARGNYSGCILSNPLGPYYTELTYQFSAHGNEVLHKLWDENPIETATVSVIPDTVHPDALRSHRLSRVTNLVLHFQGMGYTALFDLLPKLELKDWQVVSIRNVPMTPDQLRVLRFRTKLNIVVPK